MTSIYTFTQVYLSTSFQVLALHLNISILCYFLLSFYHISEANILLFTPLHLFDIQGYCADSDL